MAASEAVVKAVAPAAAVGRGGEGRGEKKQRSNMRLGIEAVVICNFCCFWWFWGGGGGGEKGGGGSLMGKNVTIPGSTLHG